MKKINSILILIVVCFISSCQKGEIPSNNEKYIGTWRDVNNNQTDTRILIINPDAKAAFSENSTSGISYKSSSVKGYIYFEGYDFRIGSKHIGKKFKANQPPKRITVTVTPYKYYYIATFNGVDYKKD